jgi:hypothetical protein
MLIFCFTKIRFATPNFFVYKKIRGCPPFYSYIYNNKNKKRGKRPLRYRLLFFYKKKESRLRRGGNKKGGEACLFFSLPNLMLFFQFLNWSLICPLETKRKGGGGSKRLRKHRQASARVIFILYL